MIIRPFEWPVHTNINSPLCGHVAVRHPHSSTSPISKLSSKIRGGTVCTFRMMKGPFWVKTLGGREASIIKISMLVLKQITKQLSVNIKGKNTKPM